MLTASSPLASPAHRVAPSASRRVGLALALALALAASLAACTVDPEDGPVGENGGEPPGGAVSCDGVCAHLVKVCTDEPAGCEGSCGQWTEAVRGCTLDATDCTTAAACRSNPDAT